MDTKPIRELIAGVREYWDARVCVVRSTDKRLSDLIVAAESALAEEECMVRHLAGFDDASSINESLRLADELSEIALAVEASEGKAAFLVVGQKAREYRKSRGLEE